MLHMQSEKTGTAGSDFRHRIAHPPQPRVREGDGESQLSHTAVYVYSGSIEPSSCSTRMSVSS